MRNAKGEETMRRARKSNKKSDEEGNAQPF